MQPWLNPPGPPRRKAATARDEHSSAHATYSGVSSWSRPRRQRAGKDVYRATSQRASGDGPAPASGCCADRAARTGRLISQGMAPCPVRTASPCQDGKRDES